MSFKNKLPLCGIVSVLLASASPAEGKPPQFNPVWEEYQESAKELEQLHQAYQENFPRHREIELRPPVVLPELRNGLVVPITSPRKDLSTLELLARKRLSRSEFDQLRQEVKTIDDYLYVVQLRGLYYPRKESAEFKYDYLLSYGAPLVTHNRGHGVCEEFALNFGAYFVDKPGYELYLFAFDDNKRNVGHAVTIFKDPQGNWGFSDNLEVPPGRYYSKREAIAASLAYSQYDPKDTLISQIRLKPGRWIYDDNISKRLGRKMLPQ